MIIIGLQFCFKTPKFQLLFAIENTNMFFFYFNTNKENERERETHTHTEMHVEIKICFWRESKWGLEASFVVVVCIFSCVAQPRNPRTSQESFRREHEKATN